MSELLKKSKNNLDSADILTKQHGFYSSSVHCSYYSCLQMIVYIIKSTPLSREFKAHEQKVKDKPNKRDDELGLHNLYIGFISQYILKSRVSDDFSNFNFKIQSLKTARVDSDYKENEITEQRANDSYERAIIVRDLLVKHFNIQHGS